MSYSCYLDGVELPTPAKLTVKIKNQNKTLVLLDEGEVNFLRTAGLTELILPLTFSMLEGGTGPDRYLNLLEKLKTSKKHTRFILARVSPDGKALFDTNMEVSVEDYNIVEDARNGLDVDVDVSLKQWRDYGTKTVTVEKTESDGQVQTVTTEKERDESSAPTASTHTVREGDTLWALAAKYYGAGDQYNRIYEANTELISNPSLIYPGQVITIP